MPSSSAGQSRKKPDLQWEKKHGYPTLHLIGVDEVGRGCLAGPVVAGAVALPSVISYETHPFLSEIADSKLLKPETRERLAPLIEEWAPAAAVGFASVEEIDTINIYHAAHLAMKRAIEQVYAQLKEKGLLRAGSLTSTSHILVDGNALPKGLPAPASAIVKGDMQCLSIAASSVIAKVWRDRLMDESEVRYPGYGFGVHKGYSTPAHSKALKELGACPIHRKTFAPVAQALARAGKASLIPPSKAKTQLGLFAE